MIEQDLGWFGKIIVRLVGLSWAVATCDFSHVTQVLVNVNLYSPGMSSLDRPLHLLATFFPSN